MVAWWCNSLPLDNRRAYATVDRIPLVDIKMMDTINQKWSLCIAFLSKNAPLSHSLLACIFDLRIYVPSSVRKRERGIFGAIPCRRWRKK